MSVHSKPASMQLVDAGRLGRLFLVFLFAVIPFGNESSAAGLAPAISSPSAGISNTVLVRFRVPALAPGAPSLVQRQLLDRAGATGMAEPLGEPGFFCVTLPVGTNADGVAALLQHDPSVIFAEPDRSIQLQDPVARYENSAATTSITKNDWALTAIHAREAWRLGNGNGVVVAVLDTGVSDSHPDLANRVLPGWNFVRNNSDASDDDGHGTFVAGLIAASSSQSGPIGVAPGASILPVKILDSSGVGSTSSFVAGIIYAVNSGARIINISASGASDSAALNDALAYAESHSVVVVASSGNDANEQAPYPAAVTTVLAVSATDHDNKLASFSSFGPYVDLAAPGVDVSSTWWSLTGGNGYLTASGSSASAPLVSGVAAIVAGLRPDATAATLREIITESAQDIGSPGIDAQTGFGLIDAYASALIGSSPVAAVGGSITMAKANGNEHLMLQAGGFTPGEALTIWTSDESGYRVSRSVAADDVGNLSADLGPAWRFPQGTLIAYAVGNASHHVVKSVYSVAVAPAVDAFKPVGPIDTTSDRIYFAATGHTLAYGFKQFWESQGGLAVFGYPISEEFSERNPDTGKIYTVQYFERNRFEYHPEYSGTPWEVSLGRLGIQVASHPFPIAPAPSGANVLYFDTTEHTLSGSFRSYWESHGGLAIFGYPTSEPFEQGGLLVQYFERSRFELHPDLPSGSQVLLSRLGVDLAREEGYLQ